ncbi:acetylcholinesterase-like [Penaeus chinensis]|uniref:acetylcholinesterase-like n=1 Tax=Penaeus chinensis TaxID=139456 RepID=UPI001FB5C04A|nr:acetylcholinesterase-like [Penaeus chinensis]
MTVQVNTYFRLALVLTAVLGLCAATDLHNSLINSSTLEVNEPRREDKGRKVKTARTKDALVVQTKTGLVRGFREKVLGEYVDVFLGIPFAKPPLGDLRFKKPVPIDPWHGIFDATTLPKSCIQEAYASFPGFEGEEMWNPNTELSEDCLYLNLWVPASLREPGAKPAEVLVWIYGGGYMAGTSTLEVYDGDLMAVANNFIVASMQYRVGAFGYIYLDIDEAPGNQGMYDQALAMKWIKDNAPYFGGNPERITLFGESAGASSAAFHLLSPVSIDLFDKVILQSGVPNNPWAIMSADKAYDIALKLVDDCKCNSSLVAEDPSRVMECMRRVDAASISIEQWNSYGGILQFPSTPIVDGAFLPDDPMEMIQRGECKKTQVLLGSNKDEGTFFILYDFLKYFKKDGENHLRREEFLEIINEIFKDWSAVEREAIIFQYTSWEDMENGYLNQKAVSDVVGDYFFVCPTNLFAQLYAENCDDVYYYFFTHRTSINPWGEWMGVLHADEINYVFGLPLNRSNGYTHSEAEFSRRLMQYYKKFAATGRPVDYEDEWPVYTRAHPRYYEWNPTSRSVGKGPRATACAFWNELMPMLREKQTGGICESEMQKALNSAPVFGSFLLAWITCFFTLFLF